MEEDKSHFLNIPNPLFPNASPTTKWAEASPEDQSLPSSCSTPPPHHPPLCFAEIERLWRVREQTPEIHPSQSEATADTLQRALQGRSRNPKLSRGLGGAVPLSPEPHSGGNVFNGLGRVEEESRPAAY
ncbi:uncharacterized protein AB9W97_011891 isoform 1-T1 [Spinachia spinachia]